MSGALDLFRLDGKVAVVTGGSKGIGMFYSQALAEAGAYVGVGAIQRRSIKRVEVPEDLVGTLLYLASPASEFLTGQTIAVNGGDYLH